MLLEDIALGVDGWFPDAGKSLLFNVLLREKQVKQFNLPKYEDGDHAIGSNIHELSQ